MTEINLSERAEKALRIAESVTDKAEVYLASNELLTIRMASGKVIESKGISDTGIGIRLIVKGGIGFSSTCDLSDETLKSAVYNAEIMAKHRKLIQGYDFPHPVKAKPAQIFDKGTANLLQNIDEATTYAHRMIDACSDVSPKVIESAGTLDCMVFKKKIMNSNGVDLLEEGTGWSAFMASIAQEGLEMREGTWSGSSVKVSDFDPEYIGKKSGNMAVKSLGGETIREGDYEVILQPPAATPFVETIAKCTNPMVMEGELPLLNDRLGEQIGSELFTLRMNPRRLGLSNIGAYDDEGVPVKELTLFNKGVYTTSPYDTLYAKKEGVESTGSGFRGIVGMSGGTRYTGKMYHTEPAPGTVGLEVESGENSFEEMIESTKLGLVLGTLHYATVVLRTRGDYTGLGRAGTMLVKNGEIVGAVQKCRLTDNILHMASRIEMVGKSEQLSHWSQTSYSIPPIKIAKAHFIPYEL